jgi:iron complex transport system substrate-binding protein
MKRAKLLLLVLVLLLVACGGSTATTTKSTVPQVTATPAPILDAYGKPVIFPTSPPQRIVSLTAADSEILAALGLTNRTVGVDSYTDYPAAMAAKPKVTDASGNANIEFIVSLKPDLILSYGGETRTADLKLESLGFHVADLPVANLTGSIEEILTIGRLTFTEPQAEKLVNALFAQINAIKAKAATIPASQRVTVYMEADYSTPGKPYVYGGGSFGDEMIRDAGGINIFGNDSANGGYPQVSDEAVINANPQVIILTEGIAYGGAPSDVYKRPNWGRIAAVQSHRVYAIEPDLIARPGPRIVEGLQEVAHDLYPSVFPNA